MPGWRPCWVRRSLQPELLWSERPEPKHECDRVLTGLPLILLAILRKDRLENSFKLPIDTVETLFYAADALFNGIDPLTEIMFQRIYSLIETLDLNHQRVKPSV